MAGRYLKTDGLTLRTRPLGEADRLITFLSWERGKMVAVARGARKIKSKLAPAVDLFTHGRYQFYRGRGLATVTGAEVVRRFTSLALDPALFWYGQHLAGLADRLTEEAIPCPAVCSLVLTAWTLLEEEQAAAELVVRAAELHLLHLAGYTPHLHACLGCGSPGTAFFSAARGGVLCPACAGGGSLVMDRGTAALARRLMEAPLELAGKVRAADSQIRELSAAVRSFLRYYLEADFRPCPSFAVHPGFSPGKSSPAKAGGESHAPVQQAGNAGPRAPGRVAESSPGEEWS